MQHLILLHGSIGSKEQFDLLAERLSDDFLIHRFNFSGHGGTPPAEKFSIAQFADEVIRYVEALSLAEKPVAVFGYSMGGYVATYAALQQPELFSRVMTLATKWQWDIPTAQKEITQLDAATIEAKVPAFAEKLKVLHAPNDWKVLLNQTATMLMDMGQRPPLDVHTSLTLQVPVCLLVGDRDKTVSIEETLQMYRNLPGASFGVLPGTPHPLEKADTNLLASIIRNYFS